jgi:REP element-mobilizing transposase RayT
MLSRKRLKLLLMGKPIVIAHHLIWTAYGTWLPNDTRGSGSKRVACDVLAQLGELHYGRKRVQPAGWEIRAFYTQAESRLMFPVQPFTLDEIQAIASAFADVCETERFTCYACAVMPDHVHLVIRKHKDQAEDMIEKLRVRSRKRLEEHAPRFIGHPIWTGGGGWKVFLDHPDDVARTIRYVERNPTQARMAEQSWSFVKPYDRWPLHPGHSANSPYVKALKKAGRYP